jgi:hypothetical protein
METGDYGVCQCEVCRKRQRHPVSRFSWEDMALMYPIAADAIRSVSKDAWLLCEAYTHPEPYRGKKEAPDFGDGKAAWADEAIAAFPQGDTVWVQWVADEHVPPKKLYEWTALGKVPGSGRRHVMRAHFATYWRGYRGELAVDWLADLTARSMAAGCDTMSIFGEVSAFHAGAELNYLAFQHYGSAANPRADLDLFLREVAGPLLGGPQAARDYLRFARLLPARAEIPGALKDIYTRLGKLPPHQARRWVWLANFLTSFLEQPWELSHE